MELEITWKRVIKIWWAFFWRNILIVILSTIAGFIIGFSLSFAGRLFGSPEGTVSLFRQVLSIAVGLALSLLPVKWILGKDFGEFRLVLLHKEQPGPTSSGN